MLISAQIGDCCWTIHESDTGTIHGSVLGPVLYYLTKITNFEDDNFVVFWNMGLSKLIVDLEKELKMIIKWLKDSGLVVISSKTDLCLFHRNDQQEIHVIIWDILVKSSKRMNVLGVTFDCKLNWKEHVALTKKIKFSSLRN
jgi:hypothetical protein